MTIMDNPSQAYQLLTIIGFGFALYYAIKYWRLENKIRKLEGENK